MYLLYIHEYNSNSVNKFIILEDSKKKMCVCESLKGGKGR